MKRLLVVGALPDEKNKLQYGGATVLMKNFVEYLGENSINFDFAQTNRVSDIKRRCKDSLKSSALFFPDFLLKIWKCDVVMFNFSDHGVVSLFPLLSKIVRRLGKKVVLRKFGGSFDIYLSTLSDEKRRDVLDAISRADLILFETKSGIQHLKSELGDGINIEWFPNVRKLSARRKNPDDFNKKLVFLSHISDEKGVGDLLKVKSLLPEGYELHFYGAIKDDRYIDFPWSDHGISYHGEISSENVLDVLVNSLLLLLLTSYREGYPGIIIEAFSVGLPVITSNVGGIPEMYTDGVEGMMVKCGDVPGIVRSILSVTPERYGAMCQASFDNFVRNFEADKTNLRILSLINSL